MRGIRPRATEGSSGVSAQSVRSQGGEVGQRRSRARSNGNQPYLIACGVRSGADRASATFDGENCAQEAWPEGTREAVRRALQGKAWAGGGDRGRVRTALGRRYAHARGAGAHRALLKELIDWRGWRGRGRAAGGGDGGGEVDGDGGGGGGDSGGDGDGGCGGGGCSGGRVTAARAAWRGGSVDGRGEDTRQQQTAAARWRRRQRQPWWRRLWRRRR